LLIFDVQWDAGEPERHINNDPRSPENFHRNLLRSAGYGRPRSREGRNPDESGQEVAEDIAE
jgi:hypothetical protein